MHYTTTIYFFVKCLCKRILSYLPAEVYFGRHRSNVPDRSIVFFPCQENILGCGLTGIVAFINNKKTDRQFDAACLDEMVEKIKAHGYTYANKMICVLIIIIWAAKNRSTIFFKLFEP